jgi:effector-binding domain-containing protein
VISEPKIDYFEAQNYMGVRTIAPFKGMFAEVDKLLKEVRIWIKERAISDQGPLFLRYHVIDMNGPMDIEVGFVVPSHLPSDARIKPGVLPAGHYANLTYYGGGMAGNKALIGWGQAHGIAWDRQEDPAGDAFACRYEMYLNAPRLQPRKTQGVKLAIKILDDQTF